MKSVILAAALLSLTACAAMPNNGAEPFAKSSDWRKVATDSDRQRLREWRTSFVRGLDQARKSGHAAEIAAEGRLLEPDAGIGPSPIPNGPYKCRVIKVGAKSEGLLDYIAYPAFDCRIQQEKDLQSLSKLGGSQRHVGLLFAADTMRQVFLGTLVLGNEQRAMQYGHDPDRDLAGWVERIGDRRWRLLLPYPKYESTIDVVELTPAN